MIYNTGWGDKVLKGPSIRYIGPNFGDFFLKGPAMRYSDPSNHEKKY